MKKEQIFVSHGMTTHPIEDECDSCAEVEREFNEAMKSGEVERALVALDKEFNYSKHKPV